MARAGHRYLIVGATVYLFEVAVILGSQALGCSPLVAVGLGFWLGLVLSFSLQKLFTFNDWRFERRVLGPQAVAVSLLVLFNFAFTLGLTKLFAGVLPAVVARTIALGITTVWNYYLYRTRIFRSAPRLEALRQS